MSRGGAIVAASGVAVLALAGAAGAAVPAVRVEAGPARPAESGARDSSATVGPLAIGAAVRDETGAEIGHVTRLTTDKQGRSVAEVRDNEDVYTIPASDLFARGGAAYSRLDRDQLKRLGMAH
ncbi:MAG TPA: hypothetical protein VMT68_12060 [Caulobacteraceae bacterium]|nr:hypothetical protein [Caulobacteraceae bacterium]